MTSRHTIARAQLLLLLRDARGRFTRIRATLAQLAATVRRRQVPRGPRRPVAAEQLVLF